MSIKTLNNRKNRKAAGIVTGIAAFGFLVASVMTTSAYFSDSHDGNISGTLGTIQIVGSGGTGANGLDLSFDQLLPGEAQTVNLTYENTGNTAQDVHLRFNNADALHALNDLGSYGELHITADGAPVFDSANLKDNLNGTCGTLSPTGCWPLPETLAVASDVAPGATGTIAISFNYASKLSIQNPGERWNEYPLGAPTSSGLPYQLVATQVGQLP